MNLGEANLPEAAKLQCRINGNTHLACVFSEVVREKQTKKLKWPNTVLVGVTALWWSFASHMQDFGFISRAEKKQANKSKYVRNTKYHFPSTVDQTK